MIYYNPGALLRKWRMHWYCTYPFWALLRCTPWQSGSSRPIPSDNIHRRRKNFNSGWTTHHSIFGHQECLLSATGFTINFGENPQQAPRPALFFFSSVAKVRSTIFTGILPWYSPLWAHNCKVQIMHACTDPFSLPLVHTKGIPTHGKRLMPYSYAILQAPAAYRPWDDAYLIRRINREEDDDYHFNTIIAF